MLVGGWARVAGVDGGGCVHLSLRVRHVKLGKDHGQLRTVLALLEGACIDLPASSGAHAGRRRWRDIGGGVGRREWNGKRRNLETCGESR